MEYLIAHIVHGVWVALVMHGHGMSFGDGFLGIGGSASKTDRQNQLAGYGDLGNIFNTGLSDSKSSNAAGQQNLGTAAGFDNKVLNGNRSTIMSALSPQISSITGQANQNKKQEAALGTARGGGTNAENQQRQQQTQGAISTAVGGAQPAAAKDLASIGGTQAGIGVSQLGTAGNAAGQLTGDATSSYGTTSAQNMEAGAGLGKMLAAGIFGF